MKSRILALVLSLVLLLSVAMPAFADETTDATTVTAQTMTEWANEGYPEVTELQIATVSDFKIFMTALQEQSEPVFNKSVSALKPEGSTIAFVGVTIYLTADLDLNPGWECTMDASWDHLENDSNFVQDSLDDVVASMPEMPDYTIQVHKDGKVDQKAFGGMFDGMGHTIIGLCIVSSGTASAESLFGAGHSDTDFVVGVKNLSLKNSYIEGTNPGLASLFSGITSGTNALIENCYVDVDLHNTSTADEKNSCSTGGLVGQVAGNLTIKNTVYAGDIFSGELGRNDHRHVGSVAGLVEGAETADGEAANLIVENFAFTGNINWEASQRISALIGRVQNQADIQFKNILALGNVLSYQGGLCWNFGGIKEGTTAAISIENCLYQPNVSQTQVFEKTEDGGNKFVGFRMDEHSRTNLYIQTITSVAQYETLTAATKVPGVKYVKNSGALGSVDVKLNNIVTVNNQDYLGAAATAGLTQNGIEGFQAMEEGLPLPSALVAMFGANVAGKSEITNPAEPEPPAPPTEATEPEETTPVTPKPTAPNKGNNDKTEVEKDQSGDMTIVIIGIVAAVVLIGAAVAVVIIVKKKKAKQ
jgi:hypothetical protein